MENKLGRPLKPDDQRADERIYVRLLASEKDAWQQAADSEGLKLSAWIKEQLNKAAKRILKTKVERAESGGIEPE